MKKYTIILFLLILFLSCKNQVKPIGEGILDLENFDFDTKVSELYPERLKSKEYTDSYIVKGYTEESLVRVSGSEYLQGSKFSLDSIAKFDRHIFQAVNLVATSDNKIKLINGVAHWVSSSEINDLFKLLNDNYGQPKNLICSWKNELVLYEWTLDDRIIRFVSTVDNDSNALNLDLIINKSYTVREEEPVFSYYFYVLNLEYKKDILEDIYLSGDLVYFRED
ncbi:hypothetical protein Celal_1697 [Cellulophaga algicola DSM 14237]|uniref:Lipoprotein n=1 Tax=Cellulophaga algicola (strain DSM 14237 / IC166 / ACAM 630) TaxID=688270 RepID=E6XCL0_CELAD|nr:hypothetical protein [Cellulophaga algicola]ADV48999.1 hypothetical protein Celal_1697 [Cellulophaga algicola DSM 14237]